MTVQEYRPGGLRVLKDTRIGYIHPSLLTDTHTSVPFDRQVRSQLQSEEFRIADETTETVTRFYTAGQAGRTQVRMVLFGDGMLCVDESMHLNVQALNEAVVRHAHEPGVTANGILRSVLEESAAGLLIPETVRDAAMVYEKHQGKGSEAVTYYPNIGVVVQDGNRNYFPDLVPSGKEVFSFSLNGNGKGE